MSSVLIPSRFNGPIDSANGGIAAGRVAALLGCAAPVTVTLRAPPPLDIGLRTENADGVVRAYHEQTLVAEATRAQLEVLGAPVPAVPFDEALRCAADYPGHVDHPFPTCFVCGVDRRAGDGLAVFAGPVHGDPHHTAAPFVPSEPCGDDLVWAILDCPGGWTIGIPGRAAVLGRMTAQVFDVPALKERCVIVGALDQVDRRKAFTRTTAYGEDGRMLGRASAIWIEIDR